MQDDSIWRLVLSFVAIPGKVMTMIGAHCCWGAYPGFL